MDRSRAPRLVAREVTCLLTDVYFPSDVLAASTVKGCGQHAALDPGLLKQIKGEVKYYLGSLWCDSLWSQECIKSIGDKCRHIRNARRKAAAAATAEAATARRLDF